MEALILSIFSLIVAFMAYVAVASINLKKRAVQWVSLSPAVALVMMAASFQDKFVSIKQASIWLIVSICITLSTLGVDSYWQAKDDDEAKQLFQYRLRHWKWALVCIGGLFVAAYLYGPAGRVENKPSAIETPAIKTAEAKLDSLNQLRR